MSCSFSDRALARAQVAVQLNRVSGMLGGQAVAAVAVHLTELLQFCSQLDAVADKLRS